MHSVNPRLRSAPFSTSRAEQDGPVFFDLGLYVRRRALIGFVMLVAVLLGILFSLLRPYTYTAKTTLLIGAGAGQGSPAAAEGERRAYVNKVQQLSVRRARLQAEIAGAEALSTPPELRTDSGDPFAVGLLNGERQLFAARRQAFEENVEKFRQERALADQRVDTLKQQAALVAVQQRSIDREVEGLQSLADRKLIPAPRLGDMQRTAAMIASRKVEIESEIARTEQGKNQADQRMTQYRNQRRSEVLAELQGVEAELHDLAIRSETLRAVTAASLSDQKFDPGVLANQAEIVTSDPLARRTVERLKLDADPAFAKAPAGEDTPASRTSAAVAALQANLAATRVGPGSRLDITYRAKTPAQAALVANTVADVYLNERDGPAIRTGAEPRFGGAPGTSGPTATILRSAEPPTRHDGPGLVSVCAAALVLGLGLGLALAAALEFAARSGRRGTRFHPSRLSATALEGDVAAPVRQMRWHSSAP